MTKNNNNFQNIDFSQQQFNAFQTMIREAVIVVDIDFFDFFESSDSQNTSASIDDNNIVFNDR